VVEKVNEQAYVRAFVYLAIALNAASAVCMFLSPISHFDFLQRLQRLGGAPKNGTMASNLRRQLTESSSARFYYRVGGVVHLIALSAVSVMVFWPVVYPR
jgi:hypothetical protein